MSVPFRIIFAGTSNFSARHLDVLISSGYNIVGVFTQPDHLAGRKKKLIANPVKILAEEKKILVFQPVSLHSLECQTLFASLNADVMVVVAYGCILPKAILDVPRFGCINVHGSLLPRWRGAAPIQRALLAGDIETGVTIIKMDPGLDTGDILYKFSCPISDKDTSATLFDKLAELGSRGLIDTLRHLTSGKAIYETQDESLVTYAKKLNKDEARIDWSLPAVNLERCIRAFNPWPTSWIKIDQQLVKIWKASVIKNSVNLLPGTIIKANKQGIQVSTVKDVLNLEILQVAGKKMINAQDILNSHYKQWFIPGIRLS